MDEFHISDETYAEALKAFDSLSDNDKAVVREEAVALLNENLNREKMFDDIAGNAESILEEIDAEFDRLSTFDRFDWSVFGIAIALHCLRQYLGPDFTDKDDRLDHKKAEEKVKGKNIKKQKRGEIKHGFYHPSLIEIQTKPVPFDITSGSAAFGKGVNGDHRCYTLGHDPLLGYFFGTMNILTSTVTLSNLDSFHEKDKFCTDRNGITSVKDWWTNKADLSKIIKYSKSRLCDEGMEGKQAFISALFKEFIHLRSDIHSKDSLPLPGINRISEGTLAKELCDNEFNLANLQVIGAQAVLSVIINAIIYLIHRCIRPNGIDPSIYKAKTKMILVWSNFIASESNLLYCFTTGNRKKLDLGGLLITLKRIISDFDSVEKIQTKFRRKSFQEFLNNPYNSHLLCYLR